MPLIKLETSADIAPEEKAGLLKDLSSTISDVTGKPEAYVMATINSCGILMAGTDEPAAFADVRGIGGLDPDTNTRLSDALCNLLSDKLNIPPDRTYLNFTDVKASNWGWNNGTF